MASTNILKAGPVLDSVAVLMNDPQKDNFRNEKIIPFLNIALQELQETFQLNNVPITDAASSEIFVPAGESSLEFNVNKPNRLPDDLVEPRVLWERHHGIDPYVPMTPIKSLPRWQQGISINQLIWYVWESQSIKFLAANQPNDIKMEYIRSLFAPVVDENSPINVINAKTFLEFRASALCASFYGENPTRAMELNGFASDSIDRITIIGIKGRQSMLTRRRPFRLGYKSRN